jgi:hypothetical protein
MGRLLHSSVSLRLARSNRLSRDGASHLFHLRTDTDSISETLCFFGVLDNGQSILEFGNSVTSEKLYLNFELTAESLLDKYYTISSCYQQAIYCSAIKCNDLKQSNCCKRNLLAYYLDLKNSVPNLNTPLLNCFSFSNCIYI